MRLLRHLLFVSLISFGYLASAQINPSSYYGVSSSKKTSIYSEEFSSGASTWGGVSTTNVTSYVSGGYFYYESKTNKSYSTTKNPFRLDDSRDFEIEVRFKRLSGKETSFMDFIWGRHITGTDRFHFGITGSGKYGVDRYSNSKYNPIVNDTQSSYVKKYDFNKFTIRKYKGYYYFFLNGNYLAKKPFQSLYGPRIGFLIPPYGKIQVDYIRAYYINSGSSISTATPNTRKSTISTTSGSSFKDAASYGSYSSSEKTDVFYDGFSNNNKSWKVGTTASYSGKVSLGYYRWESKNTYTQSSTKYISLDESKDFEIETRIKAVSGSETSFFGLAFGRKDSDAYYSLGYSRSSQKRSAKRADGKWNTLIAWGYESAIKKDQYNKLTVRKVGSNYFMFINEKFLKKVPFESFFGDNVGFIVPDKSVMYIDYLRVSYLNKPGAKPTYVDPLAGLSPADQIKEYVKGKMQVWAQKGEFEKTVDYQRRVSPEARKSKIDQFVKEKSSELKKSEKVKYPMSKFRIDKYDADNETFLVKGEDRDYVLHVPITKAPTVKNSFSRGKIMNHDFILTDEGFKLSEFTVSITGVGTYKWNHNEDRPYKQVVANYDPNADDIEIVINDHDQGKKEIGGQVVLDLIADVDQEENIPQTSNYNPNAIAIVIGNTEYDKNDVPNVDYATNDASSIKRYLTKTFGFKEENVIFKKNINKSEMEELFGNNQVLGTLKRKVKQNVSDVYVFYSGHGAPDTDTKKGYLMTVNAVPGNLSLTGYSIETLYTNLDKLNPRSVQVVIDACFSGGTQSGKVIIDQASPLGIEVLNPAAKIRNGTVITASQGDQIASWYQDKRHGLLTYFYLKGVSGRADFNGDKKITVREIRSYLTSNIREQADKLHDREQTPAVYSTDDDKVIVSLN